jgi:hypothetical protein
VAAAAIELRRLPVSATPVSVHEVTLLAYAKGLNAKTPAMQAAMGRRLENTPREMQFDLSITIPPMAVATGVYSEYPQMYRETRSTSAAAGGSGYPEYLPSQRGCAPAL